MKAKNYLKPLKCKHNKCFYRVNIQNLDYVCLDCCDFLKCKSVSCENCPIDMLKKRLRKGG